MGAENVNQDEGGEVDTGEKKGGGRELQQSDSSLKKEEEESNVGVTKYRWVILAIFSLQNLVNSIMWICYAPIQTTITEYYNISTTKANLITLTFLICSLPSTPASMYLQERFGLRIMVWIGSITQSIGGWVRYAGKGRHDFGVAIAGSVIAGPSMSIFMCLPSKLAASWFPKNERTIATSVASLAGVLGVLAGYVIGPAIIKDLSDVPTFLLVQALIPSVATLSCLLFRHSPPMPASLSETVEKIPLRAALYVAFTNKSFLLVLLGFTLGLGCFNGLSTLIDEIVHPLGYSEDDSSLFGALLIGLGLVGAGLLSFYVEKTHKYKVAMMVSIWGCVFCCLWMLLALTPHNGPSLTAAFAFIGIFGLGLLPLTLECGCELLFPVPEVVTNGLLMVCGQTFGVVIVFVMDAMKEKGSGKLNNACWLLWGCIILSALCISSFYPSYKRITHDNHESLTSPTRDTSIESAEEPPSSRWWRIGY